MIEIAAGLLVILAAAALALGAGAGIPLLSAAGPAPVAAVAALGLALVAHGAYRRRRNMATGPTYWLETGGLATAAAAAVLGLAMFAPSMFAPLGLVKIGGFPLNYYAVGQGIVIALVLVVFAAARKQDGIEQKAEEQRQP
jgi:putative solute:sodium symporter small subunit